MYKYFTRMVPGALASLLMVSPSFASGPEDLITDDLITSSNLTTPWQVCDTESQAIDVTLLDSGACAFRTTPALPNITYTMSCGVTVAKFASITLAFLDADYNEIATRSTEVTEHVSGAYSVTLASPANTVHAAIGIYGETGSGFQDCVLIDSTPTPEPTKGSISGVTFFDENDNSIFDTNESPIAGSSVALSTNGTEIHLRSTGNDGSYNISGLDIDACYTVEFGAADATLQLGQPGGDNDANADGRTAEICLTEATPDVANIDAAFVPTPPVVPPADNAVCGLAWTDLNANGVFDGNDSTLANVKVKLFDASSNMISMLNTDDYGNYVFDSLPNGDYRIMFNTPDGHEPTIASGQPLAGTSSIGPAGNSALFNLPADRNTDANSACTLQNVNGGFIRLPVALAPTIARDDSVRFDVGVDFTIDFLANDAACDGVNNVDLIGHNVPGNVTFDAQQQRFVVTDTTAFGVFSIEYGLRGNCGSFDTASIQVELVEVIPPPPPAAPDEPLCRIETRGSTSIGGVDVFNPLENGFASAYNLYDRNRNLVTTVSGADFTHRVFIGANPRPAELIYQGNFETEWNGTEFGFDQTSIFFISAVENNVESSLSECARDNISPIALDLDNKGRIARLSGSYQVDVDGDGIKESLREWFAPNAGILVTADAAGQISGKHMFGNVPGVHTDGFAELATLDTNKDGQLKGDELSQLAIWNDRNSDTIVDEGELSTLAQHKIIALAVTHYKYMARATKANGQSVLMEDVWLPMESLAITQK